MKSTIILLQVMIQICIFINCINLYNRKEEKLNESLSSIKEPDKPIPLPDTSPDEEKKMNKVLLQKISTLEVLIIKISFNMNRKNSQCLIQN